MYSIYGVSGSILQAAIVEDPNHAEKKRLDGRNHDLAVEFAKIRLVQKMQAGGFAGEEADIVIKQRQYFLDEYLAAFGHYSAKKEDDLIPKVQLSAKQERARNPPISKKCHHCGTSYSGRNSCPKCGYSN